MAPMLRLEQTYERDRFARAHTLEQFAQTLLRLGALNHSREEVLEGKHALAAAWEIFRQTGDLKYDDYFAWRLRRFEATLKALK